MPNMYKYFATILSFILIFSMPAKAQEEDFNIWGVATSSIDTSDKTFIWLEAQPRFTNDADRLGQLLLRTAIGYKLTDTTSALAGYAYIFTDPEGPTSSNEHRIWQQLSFRVLGNGKNVTLSGRTRLEERFFEGEGDVAIRFRQQLKLTAPLGDKFKAVLYTEPFIGFTDNDVQADGINVWRNFVGINIPIGKGFAIEPGYMNQYVVRDGADRIDHVAVIGISSKF